MSVIWAWSCSSGSTTAARVEPQHLGQVGALHPPFLPAHHGLLFEIGEHVAGPLHLHQGDQLPAQLRDALHQVAAAFHRIKGPGVHPALLVNAKVHVGRVEQRQFVLLGLDVPVSRVQHSPRHEWLENGIRRGEHTDQAATAIEKVQARRRHDPLVEVGAAAIVPQIVEPDVERRKPEHLGLRRASASATQTLACAAATTSGRASVSRSAVARLMGKRRSVASIRAGFIVTPVASAVPRSRRR